MKKEYIEKAKIRQKQSIKLLTNKPSFVDVIAKLRTKWDIPSHGIKTQDELDMWYKNLNEKTDQFISKEWQAKRRELIAIKNKGNHAEFKKAKDVFNNEIPRNSLLRDIKKLVQQLKLSPRWIEGIRRYLLFNDPENMGMFVGPVINTKFDMEFETETLYLEIEANTTLDDVKAVWPSVMEAQSRLLYKNQKKFQPIRNFDRNKKAYELHTQGKKYAEIADFMSTESKTYGEEDIGKMIERHKKKVDIS